MTGTPTHGIVHHQGLDDAELAAVKELARACEQHDGIDLRLSWSALADQSDDGPHVFLAYRDGALAGFLTMEGLGDDEAEATGAVHPGRRRQGVFRALVDAAADACYDEATMTLVFYVDRRSSTAPEALSTLDAEGSSAEMKMRLDDAGSVANIETPLDVRPAAFEDANAIGTILANDMTAGVSTVQAIVRHNMELPNYEYYIAALEDTPIGTLNIQTLDDDKYIYGFVVAPEYRGKGYGRAILARVLRDLAAAGMHTVYLEVDPDNTPAITLYRSLGFRELVTYDYYRMEI